VSKEEKMKRLPKAVLPLVLLAAALPATGQTPPLNLPQPSPEASVGQTVGLTEISIHYHRPAVNKRKVWGELVPYGEVWRAGANENTTFTVSSPVKVEGKALAAGTYGLHMIPTEKEWTVVFSKMSSAWGSFSYDPKEDALRVTVTPTKAPFEERLSYSFADPSNRTATMVLHWEETAVPVHIEVDTPSVVVESLRTQLRGLPRFSWQGWNGAAAYCLRNDVNLDEALDWSNRSIQLNENFQNLRTKAGLLEKKGDTKTAEALRAKSLPLATEVDMNLYGYQLLGDRKFDEAIAVFRKNVKDHPKSWNTYDSLAEAYLTKGDKKLAAEYYNQALAMTQDETQKKRISTILAGIKG
jgi:tetratricopeptide (TPR) repeat protein